MGDILWCSHNTQLIIDALDLTYDLKDRAVGPPKIYLVSEINQYQVRNGKSNWSMLSTQYVKNSINTVEGLLKDEERPLRKVKSAGKRRFQMDIGQIWRRVVR